MLSRKKRKVHGKYRLHLNPCSIRSKRFEVCRVLTGSDLRGVARCGLQVSLQSCLVDPQEDLVPVPSAALLKDSRVQFRSSGRVHHEGAGLSMPPGQWKPLLDSQEDNEGYPDLNFGHGASDSSLPVCELFWPP